MKTFNANYYTLLHVILCSQHSITVKYSCYTLLSGLQLPCPPSCCQYQLTPFMGSHEQKVWHLNFTCGSSRIASSAYQKWPTFNYYIQCTCSIKKHIHHTH
uniref:Secreted protein n=1 Tax=Panagrolaimus sp. PS1159 TaxID=55785 RepID=A0AC35GUJ3_9BILA